MKKIYFPIIVLMMAVLGFTSCDKDDAVILEYVFVLKSDVHALDPMNEPDLQTKLTDAFEHAGFNNQSRLVLRGKSETEIQNLFVSIINRMLDELGVSTYPVMGHITINGIEKQKSITTPQGQWPLCYSNYIDDPYYKGGTFFP